MEKLLDNLLPIMGLEHDCILSREGDVTIVFKATLPEIFTLSADDYETFHQTWIKAIKLLPNESVFYKQDWFIQCKFQPATTNDSSYLDQASSSYFKGRAYLEHSTYIYLTRKPKGRKPGSSVFSNLIRPSIVPAELIGQQAIQAWEDICGQFKRILEDSGFVQLTRLKSEELESQHRKAGLVERYCSLSESEGDQLIIKDIDFKHDIHIGDQRAAIFTLGDVTDLPSVCGPRINYEPFSTDRTKFSLSFAGSLGLLLDCNHIYSQYIIIGDSQLTMKKMEAKRLRLQSLSAYSRENAISHEATNDFLNEAISQQRLPVKAHFNVMIWSDSDQALKEHKNKVHAALAQMDAVAKQETLGAAQIWWSGIPGNASDFPVNDSFDTFVEQACCFLNLEGNYRTTTPDKGIRFTDRLGKPVYADLFDAPRNEGITSNMGVLVCGTSGGGKSMTINHVLRTLHDQGAHSLTVDIGGSYKGLCELVGGYYFTYTEENPIRFNPFYISIGDVLDTEKTESLKALLISLWKQENDSFNRSEYVALSNAITGYYRKIEKDSTIFPCFDTFYHYLEEDYVEVLKGHKVKDRDFDVDNFLYVLRPFFKGGEFDYLLNARENLDLLNQPFIVIELDNIKDHPILFPVVTLIIMELFISKMRKLKGIRKVLTIDEAWKAIAKSGMAEFLKYAFKTIRKFNGIPIVITQELDDLISSPIVKDAIVNNADIKILMDMRKYVNKFDKLQDVLGLSEKSKTILLSVNKDKREICIDLGGQVTKVYRNELCAEEYYAYTTEGRERVKVMEYAEKYGGIEAGIEALVKDLGK